ncbi:MAG: hypothetical protein IT306_26345 [Chloroflexi bacterium]|nr:hypothetical protein [Chloroflexota bacterium]
MPDNIQGLEFLGICYDVLTADPLNLGASAKGVSAIDVARDGIETYTQGAYSVPIGASLRSPFNTEVKTSRTLIRNSFDFQNEFSSTLEASAGLGGLFEYSASTSFKEISSVSESRKKVFTYVTVAVQNHIVTLELDDPAKLRLGADFARSVAALPPNRATAEEIKAYGAFVRKFGTHFARRVALGGMAYSRVSSDASSVTSSREREESFKANASLEIESFKAGASASEARNSVQKVDRDNELDRTQLVFRGGIGSTQEIADDWFAGLTERPAPIPNGTELERLSNLLTSEFFPKDSAISARRQALDAAISQHIIENGGTLDGVIRYGDKLGMWYGGFDHARQAFVNLAMRDLVFHNMSAVPGNALVPATLMIVDPRRGGDAGSQEPQEVKIGSSETPVAIRVDNGKSGQQLGYLTMMQECTDNLGRTYRPIGITANPDQPTARWSLGLTDGQRHVVEPRASRPLVSGDFVVSYRPDEASGGFFRIYANQPHQTADYPLHVRASTTDPMFGDVENRNASTIQIRKIAP